MMDVTPIDQTTAAGGVEQGYDHGFDHGFDEVDYDHGFQETYYDHGFSSGEDPDAYLDGGETLDPANVTDETIATRIGELEERLAAGSYPGREVDEQQYSTLVDALDVPEAERLSAPALEHEIAVEHARNAEHTEPVSWVDDDGGARLEALTEEREQRVGEHTEQLFSWAEVVKEELGVADVEIRPLDGPGERFEIVVVEESKVTVGSDTGRPPFDEGLIEPTEVTRTTAVTIGTYDAVSGTFTFEEPPPPPARDAEGLAALGEGLFLGDFSDNNSSSALAGRVLGGLNPLADLRDGAAAVRKIWNGEEGGWSDLGWAAVGILPAFGDAAKAAKGGSRIGRALTGEAVELLDDAVDAGRRAADDLAAARPVAESAVAAADATRPVVRGPEDLVAVSGGRLVDHGGALGTSYARAGYDDLPVLRRSSAAELQTAVRYLDHGAPDGARVAQLHAVPSGPGSRSPDYVAVYEDAARAPERIEVTSATLAPSGREADAVVLATRTNERAARIEGAVVDALVRKADPGTAARPSQLLAPLTVPGVGAVPPGGAVVVNVHGFHRNAPEMVTRALEKAGPHLGDHVRRVEFTYLERAADGALTRRARAFVRDGAGYRQIEPGGGR